MKKILVAVLAVAAVLAVCPWWLGGIAARRLDRAFASLPDRAPYLKIVGNTWTDGWLRSEQQITFEFVLPGPNPHTPVALKLPDVPGFPLPGSLRFTVHNVVQHGPVLGSAGLGLARVESRLAMSDAVRGKLVEIMGTDEPVRVVTRLGFFGGGTTTLSGDGRKVMLGKLNPAMGDASIAWDAFRLSLSVSSGGKEYGMQGRQPRIEISNGKSAAHVLATGIALEGTGKRISQDIYAGRATFGIGKFDISEAGQDLQIDAIEYAPEVDQNGEFLDSGFRMGSGAVHNRMLEASGIQLKEIHFDMTMRHLHLETLQKLVTALKETDGKILDGSADPQSAVFGVLKDQGLELVKHDPELSFDRVGIVTPQGEAVLKGSIMLQGVNDADLSTGPMALLGKSVADFTIEVPQELVDRIPNGATVTGAGVDRGFLQRDGGKLVSHIEFKQGKLLVNGKAPQVPQGLRLPGMPPPGP